MRYLTRRTVMGLAAYVVLPSMSYSDNRNSVSRPECWRGIDASELERHILTDDFLLLGERHGNAADHRWQLQCLQDIWKLRPKISVGIEMLQTYQQRHLDEFASFQISEETFLERVRWPEVWGYPFSLYRGIFDFCRHHRVRMVALSCSDRLTALVRDNGWNSIPIDLREGITPPVGPSDEYVAYIHQLLSDGHAPEVKTLDRALLLRMTSVQLLWDRALATSLLAGHDSGSLMIGLMGSGHLAYGLGVPSQLRDLTSASISYFVPSEAVKPGFSVTRAVATGTYETLCAQ